MALNIDDTDNSAITGNPSNLRRVLNSFAFQIKQITGQSSWKISPHLPITQLGEKGDKGDTGATGTQGIQGEKGDKGDTGATPDPAPGAWQDIPLSTSWGNYTVGYTTPQCRKYASGLIEVKGIVKKSGNLVTNEIMCTLPANYRPTEIMLLATWASGGTSRITVETSGVIRINSGNAGGVGLNFFFGL